MSPVSDRGYLRAVRDEPAIPEEVGPAGINGPPVATSPAARALDEGAQRRLWEVSVELTGVDDL